MVFTQFVGHLEVLGSFDDVVLGVSDVLTQTFNYFILGGKVHLAQCLIQLLFQVSILFFILLGPNVFLVN